MHTGEGRDTATDLSQACRNYVWDNDPDTLHKHRDCLVDEASWGGDRGERRRH
ncbi:hypothetical protein ACFYO2_48355 [Streptomyces sp. NPDC006602]|uniref:hypothetical protein n=1 Tax=Streptomyces sp. NPDC006602 TaxID=3364751 RepID=UPI0036AF1383